MGEAKRRKALNANYGKVKVGDNYYNAKDSKEVIKAFTSIKYEDMVALTLQVDPVTVEIPKEINYRNKKEFDRYFRLVISTLLVIIVPRFFHKQKFPNIIMAEKISPTEIELNVCIIKMFEEIEGYDSLTKKVASKVKQYYYENEKNNGMILIYMDQGMEKINNAVASVSYFNEEFIKEIWEKEWKETFLLNQSEFSHQPA